MSIHDRSKRKLLWSFYNSYDAKIPTLIEYTAFHKTAGGDGFNVFTLSNDLGISATVSGFGCRIVSIKSPDRNDLIGDVSFVPVTIPLDQPTCLGALLGPTAEKY